MSGELNPFVLGAAVLVAAVAVAVASGRLARAASAGRGGRLAWWLDEVRRAVAHEDPKPRPRS